MSSQVLFASSTRPGPTAASLCSLIFALIFSLVGCSGYQNPPGKWLALNASALFFSGVELDDNAVTPRTTSYRETCREAAQEIEQKLLKKLPAQISPLVLYSAQKPPPENMKTAELKLLITRCDIDTDQSGGNFSFYLSLPVRLSLTMDEQTLLDYPIKTYEQLQTDVPNPIYEFTYAEAVARTLLLFNGKQVWVPDQ